MKKLVLGLIAAPPLALLGWAAYLVLFASPEPPFDWYLSMSSAEHQARIVLLDHHFTVAAYVITWAIQLGYLAWIGLRWQAQKNHATPRAGSTTAESR
jgi:hypothetical protein